MAQSEELKRFQAAGIKVLDYVKADEESNGRTEWTIAVRLYTTAWMMKRSYREGACYTARQYADLVGLEPQEVEGYVLDLMAVFDNEA